MPATFRIVATAAAVVAAAALAAACDKDDDGGGIRVVEAEPEPAERTAADYAAEREKARREAPEPELDEDGYVVGHEQEPREQFELVWKLGETQIDSFHRERYDIIRRLSGFKFEDEDLQEAFEPLVEQVQRFSIGRKREQLETAAERLCETIENLRGPAEAMMAEGLEELETLDEEFKALEAREAEGKTVYQRQWDRVDEAKKKASKPVSAGKFVLLGVKSMLDEAYILADHGPRRAQKELQRCLGAIAEEPLALPQAQKALERVLERAAWYRKL